MDVPVEQGAVATVVGLLGACLVALILVLIARREADQQRRRASEDVTQIRDDARAMLADAERRERRAAERERELATERAQLAELERRTRTEADALADAQRAVRLVRSRAGVDGIDPARVAFGGFSAGGQVATSLLTRFDARVYDPVDAADALSARPDALAAVYPVVSMDPAIAHAVSREKLIGASPDAARERLYSPERNVRADQPPLWLIHAEDDSVVKVENSVRLRAATRAIGAPVEAHFFERGEHGFGLMKTAGLPVAIWPELLWNWLGAHKLV